MKIAQLSALLLSLALSAFGQFDAEQFARGLRSQLGEPLARQTFMTGSGIAVTVDYAANGHVCRISLPPIAPERGRAGVQSPKGLDDFLLELVPMTLRGAELNRMSQMFGLPWVSSVEYENVLVSEHFSGKERTRVTASFKHETCSDAGH